MKAPITIIIPARNEEATITETLDALQSVRTPIDILVVCDRWGNRLDPTEKVVKEYGKTHTNVFLMPKSAVRYHGQAAAIHAAIRYTRTPYVAIVTADMSDDPATIDVMYQKALKGYDVVCASRYMHGGKHIGGPIFQALGSRCISWFFHMLTGIPVHDMSNSFRLYRRKLFDRLVFDTTMGSEISLYLLIQLYRQGTRIAEVPTVWHGRTAGTAKFTLMGQIRGFLRVCFFAVSTLRFQKKK